jgi:hypothetical protein
MPIINQPDSLVFAIIGFFDYSRAFKIITVSMKWGMKRQA